MQQKGNYRLIIYLVILITLVLAAFFLTRRTQVKEPRIKKNTRIAVNREHGFDRTVSFIEYTRHARCRMECRKITTAEVEEIMQNGSVNIRKSNIKGKPCPVYALEGITRMDDQHVRIVFAQCDKKTKVVTCIDLENEYNCTCN